jgi:Zn-dependent protease
MLAVMVPEELSPADASNSDAARPGSPPAEFPPPPGGAPSGASAPMARDIAAAPAQRDGEPVPVPIISQVIVSPAGFPDASPAGAARSFSSQPFPSQAEAPIVLAELAAPAAAVPIRRPPLYETPAARRRRRFLGPVVLFVLTCLSTFWTGASGFDLLATITDPLEVLALALQNARQGLAYMFAVMGILLAHEMGHFLQAVRYRVPASLPFFIPMPLTPLGTMGAVIALGGSQANRKELFDIGLTGPWAGLLLAFPLAWIGINTADVLPNGGDGLGGYFGDPLVFKLLAAWLRPEVSSGSQLVGHANPLVMASWVGMLVTGLNMLPIGQLDGGHVAYALLGRRSHWLARAMVAAALAFIIIERQYGWSLMLTLVIFLGTSHPPTADDRMALGPWRSALGWVSLAIPIFCLTPFPVTPG